MKQKLSLLVSCLCLVLSVQAQFTHTGSATGPTAGSYNLTPTPTTGCRFMKGAIWANGSPTSANDSVVSFTNSFRLCFDAQFTANAQGNGADGFCAVFGSHFTNTTAANNTDACLGYYNRVGAVANPIYNNSLGVEFDIFDNSNTWATYDPGPSGTTTWPYRNWNPTYYDHTQISENGSFVPLPFPLARPVPISSIATNIKDGLTHHYTITWNRPTNTLSVMVDGVFRNSATIIPAAIFTNPAIVHWGFTGGTGGQCSDQILSNITLNNTCPATLPTITGPSTVSPGSTIGLSVSATGGTWVSSNPSWASVTATGVSTCIVTGYAAGCCHTVLISYVSACGCVLTSHAVTITCTTPTVTGPTSICAGTSNTYTLTSSVGASAISWYVTPCAALTSPCTGSTTTIPLTGSLTITTPTTVTIHYSVTTGCGTTNSTYNVTILPVPTVSASISPAITCAGSPFTISATVSGGNLAWTHVGGPVPALTTPTQTLTSGPIATLTATATYRATAFRTVGGLTCHSSQLLTETIVYQPSFILTVLSHTVCAGSNLTISSTSNPPAGTTFSWTGTSGPSGSPYPSTAPFTAPTAPGTYTYNLTETCTFGGHSCSHTSSVTITVIALPTISVSATPNPVCAGSPFTISATSAGSVIWSHVGGPAPVPATLTQTLTSGLIATPTATAIYTATASVTSGGTTCTASSSVTETFVYTPVFALTATPSPVCAGSSFVLSTTPAPLSGTTFAWTGIGPGAYSFASSSAPPLSFTAPSVSVPSTYYYSLTGSYTAAGTTCSSIMSDSEIVNPTPAPPTAGNDTACYNRSLTFSVNPVVPGIIYNWSSPCASFVGTGSTITVTTPCPGSYCVTATNSYGCQSAPACVIGTLVNPCVTFSGPTCATPGSTVNITVSVPGVPAVGYTLVNYTLICAGVATPGSLTIPGGSTATIPVTVPMPLNAVSNNCCTITVATSTYYGPDFQCDCLTPTSYTICPDICPAITSLSVTGFNGATTTNPCYFDATINLFGAISPCFSIVNCTWNLYDGSSLISTYTTSGPSLTALSNLGMTYVVFGSGTLVVTATFMNLLTGLTCTSSASHPIGCEYGVAVARPGQTNGIVNVNSKDNISMVPNPNNGTFTITGAVSSSAAMNKTTIEILNQVGQIVYKDEATLEDGNINKKVTIDGNLPNGMYLLRIKGDNGYKTLKFVLDR